VILRRLEQIDLHTIFEWRNNKNIYQWCRQNSPLHWNNHQAWYDWQAKDKNTSMFIMEVGNISVGVCGLTDIDMVNRRAEFSLYIGTEHQKKGHGAEALKLLFKHGFYDLGLNRIWGETFDDNPAMALFTKLGMVHEGTRQEHYYKNGNFIDAHLISIGRKQFDSVLDNLPII
jgi:RimJ/RimL family protein N-acetyltransferase